MYRIHVPNICRVGQNHMYVPNMYRVHVPNICRVGQNRMYVPNMYRIHVRNICRVGQNRMYVPNMYRIHVPNICRVGQNRMCVPNMTVYLRLAKTIYLHRVWPYIWWFPCQKNRRYTVYIWFWPILHIFGDLPAKNTVYTPYICIIYGSGQPYSFIAGTLPAPHAVWQAGCRHHLRLGLGLLGEA